jgi:hypothetical protein
MPTFVAAGAQSLRRYIRNLSRCGDGLHPILQPILFVDSRAANPLPGWFADAKTGQA